MSTLLIPLPCSWYGRTLTLKRNFAVGSGSWVNLRHGHGPQDQVTALANRGTNLCQLISGELESHKYVLLVNI